uniref:Uncharacterized protein n=1 Tax=Anopheles albimanus TaxID=7167 RepID=A0A182FB69_ANOAL
MSSMGSLPEHRFQDSSQDVLGLAAGLPHYVYAVIPGSNLCDAWTTQALVEIVINSEAKFIPAATAVEGVFISSCAAGELG